MTFEKRGRKRSIRNKNVVKDLLLAEVVRLQRKLDEAREKVETTIELDVQKMTSGQLRAKLIEVTVLGEFNRVRSMISTVRRQDPRGEAEVRPAGGAAERAEEEDGGHGHPGDSVDVETGSFSRSKLAFSNVYYEIIPSSAHISA